MQGQTAFRTLVASVGDGSLKLDTSHPGICDYLLAQRAEDGLTLHRG